MKLHVNSRADYEYYSSKQALTGFVSFALKTVVSEFYIAKIADTCIITHEKLVNYNESL